MSTLAGILGMLGSTWLALAYEPSVVQGVLIGATFMFSVFATFVAEWA